MNHKTVRMNGKEQCTLTLASKMASGNLYSEIQTKLNVSPARAKFYVAAYIIGRTDFMAASIAADKFNQPIERMVDHIEVVSELMSGTVE